MVQNGLTSILVKWQHPPSLLQLSHLLGYKIKYKKVDDDDHFAFLEVDKWTAQVNITELEKNTKYEISVAGYTKDGPGPYSEQIVERTKNGMIFH